jgi:hypothetical protein
MSSSKQPAFITVAMAEILLVQNQLKEAAGMIKELEQRFPDDQRVQRLKQRLQQRERSGDLVQTSEVQTGKDSVVLKLDSSLLNIRWELTPESLALAKKQVRYSGKNILRLFTASPGPRGVRTAVQDFVLNYDCASMTVSGIPAMAVFAAAVGFLGHSGLFVPVGQAAPVSSFKESDQ